QAKVYTSTNKRSSQGPRMQLQASFAALTLELRDTKQDLLDAEETLEATQVDFDTALSNLEEREIELENIMAALQGANQNRPVNRPLFDQEEVFAVLKLQNPRP
ncbi:hypothetical protein BGZ76_008351, partial [Entomortierella beljakovae]